MRREEYTLDYQAGAPRPPVDDYAAPIKPNGIFVDYDNPVIDVYTPPVTDGDNPVIEALTNKPAPIPVGDDTIPFTKPDSIFNDPGVITTLESSPVSSQPNINPQGETPLSQIFTLLDLYNSEFDVPTVEPFTAIPEPGVTVISPQASGGDSSNLLLYLAVFGILVTVGAHWYFNRKKK